MWSNFLVSVATRSTETRNATRAAAFRTARSLLNNLITRTTTQQVVTVDKEWTTDNRMVSLQPQALAMIWQVEADAVERSTDTEPQHDQSLFFFTFFYIFSQFASKILSLLRTPSNPDLAKPLMPNDRCKYFMVNRVECDTQEDRTLWRVDSRQHNKCQIELVEVLSQLSIDIPTAAMAPNRFTADTW